MEITIREMLLNSILFMFRIKPKKDMSLYENRKIIAVYQAYQQEKMRRIYSNEIVKKLSFINYINGMVK